MMREDLFRQVQTHGQAALMKAAILLLEAPLGVNKTRRCVWTLEGLTFQTLPSVRFLWCFKTTHLAWLLAIELGMTLSVLSGDDLECEELCCARIRKLASKFSGIQT